MKVRQRIVGSVLQAMGSYCITDPGAGVMFLECFLEGNCLRSLEKGEIGEMRVDQRLL